MPTDLATTRLDLLATCTFGLESVVARELEQLGYKAKPVGVGRVHFEGDFRAICEANTWLRAADRVLIRIAQFDARTFDELFDGVKQIEWEKWIAREATFPVAGRSVRSQLASVPAVQRATKKAIVERLQQAHGSRGERALLPETGPTVAIEVSILKDVATFTLDTSGVGLHKRGYREGNPGEAALKETLAAGLVLLSVWRPGRPLVDPFCGSGTLPIEAAMIGRNIAPGLNRSFACEQWLSPAGDDEPLMDAQLWEDVRNDAMDAIVPNRLDPVIHASDIDEYALRLARDNARAAEVENDIQFITRDVRDISSRLDHGVILCNPPYGVRLGDEREIEALYRALPVVFRKLPTWTFHIFTGRLDLERVFGQVASRRRKLYNSKIECALFTFLGPRPPNAEREDFEGAPEDSDAQQQTPEHDPESEPFERDEASEAAVVVSDREAEDQQMFDDAGAPDTVPAPCNPASPPPSPAPRPPRSTFAEPAPTFGGLRERDKREAEDFGRCLANNMRHLRKYPSRGITCYRVYERDVPDVPLIIDRYEDRYHVAEYEREHSRSAAQQADWFDLMRQTIADVCEVPLANIYMKEKHRQAGLSQHEKLGAQKHTFTVTEGGWGGHSPLKFEVNLSDYIDTGLFLDHRLTRQMVREQSAGKRILNLFCYTGSFTVYAASGGAKSTTSVDLSNTYLDWARRNLGHNNLYAPQHAFICSDVMEFLRRARKEETYDLAVVDPPTFSNSKSLQEDWEVGESYIELLSLLQPLMSMDGVVYFSTNFRRFKMDEQRVMDFGYQIREISTKTVPPEYRNKRIHRCWRLIRTGTQRPNEEPRR